MYLKVVVYQAACRQARRIEPYAIVIMRTMHAIIEVLQFCTWSSSTSRRSALQKLQRPET